MEQSKIFTILLIGLFGGAGCISRYLISSGLNAWLGKSFPYGTLAVNIIGSFVIGIIFEVALRGSVMSPAMRLALTTGFLGGLTTFSTFSFETVELFLNGKYFVGVLNITGSLLLCFLSTYLGISLVRQLD
ncbi:MAG: fluoride efflux transporter CrcB [Chloroherpetonaceae bacterium]